MFARCLSRRGRPAGHSPADRAGAWRNVGRASEPGKRVPGRSPGPVHAGKPLSRLEVGAGGAGPEARAAEAFRRVFGRDPGWFVRAPGRVNLLGGHTDYNDGLVLPLAIERAIVGHAARRDDGRVRVHSADLDDTAEFSVGDLARRRSWIDYVQGVVHAFRDEGLPVPGLDLALASDLPREVGLSSSAALSVLAAFALDAVTGLGLDAQRLGHLGYRGESEFVGSGCGIMDPYASALGRAGCALRIDCRSREVRPVAIPDDLMVLVSDTGIRRTLADGPLGVRHDECHAAFAAAHAAGVAAPHATALRDLDESHLPALEAALADTLFRRARHVITEIARVDAFCDALAAGDRATVSALLRRGMQSQQRDFESSIPELDALCESADAQPGSLGSRITGAGFGGCAVHLVERARRDAVVAAIREGFEARFGRPPLVRGVTPSNGARAERL